MGWITKVIAADLVGSYINAENDSVANLAVAYSGVAGSVSVTFQR
jgi:hypothetical protein